MPSKQQILTTYFTNVLLIHQQLPATLCVWLWVQSDLHLFSFLKVHIIWLHYSWVFNAAFKRDNREIRAELWQQWMETRAVRQNTSLDRTQHCIVCVYVCIFDTKQCTYIDCLLQKLQYMLIDCVSAFVQIPMHQWMCVCVCVFRACFCVESGPVSMFWSFSIAAF